MSNPRVLVQTALDDDFVFDYYSLRHIILSPLEEMTYTEHRHPHYTHTH